MPKAHFYHTLSSTHQDNNIHATLQLNADDTIFAGHFPGQPVLPGACMLQIVKEILNESLGSEYDLKKADTLKFMAPIDPRMVDELELNISYKSVDADLYITAALMANAVVCFKMQGLFIASV